VITRWSYSTLAVYRECPFRAKLRYIDKIPEPERKEGNAADRGTRMHDELQAHLLGTAARPAWLDEKFFDDIDTLMTYEVECERPMFFDDCWKPTTEENRWLTIKQDIQFVIVDEATVSIDLKTGRREGNELKHYSQKSLYAIGNSIEHPELDNHIAAMWYLDQKSTWETTFSREDIERLRAKFDREVSKMMDDKLMRPRPNVVNCRWCPYSPRASGHCPVGV
jgi:CRISPR/Cas system-associated exonuclease Cas4 (RecB family)